ncbi:hypothetical protein [Crenobacter caeni]|uniref:Uncharacterized protein n=1 Tax=Crenobacter caeni TaxID=2705474 RepID=A0A6B2KUX4_9NEIS|nr:hypothetical protein [Crenobacter caeni]NDV13757.1 hypothetical protein [Crenobacter caeni]
MIGEDYRQMIGEYAQVTGMRLFAAKIEGIEARYRDELAKDKRREQAARVAALNNKQEGKK